MNFSYYAEPGRIGNLFVGLGELGDRELIAVTPAGMPDFQCLINASEAAALIAALADCLSVMDGDDA